MPHIRIRFATPEDAPMIVRFVRALADYENERTENLKLTEEDIRRDGFGPRRYFEVLIAEHLGRPAGFALFLHNYSTWEGRAGIYVEDLFVEKRARGLGLGRALMAAIARLAQARQCPRIELDVLDWNPARAFYRRVGIEHIKEWHVYRMTEPAISALAREVGLPEGGDNAS